MKKKMHFTIMGLVVAVLALALALTGCAKDASGNTNASTSESVDVNALKISINRLCLKNYTISRECF